LIEQFGFDWHHPTVAIPLLGNICSDIPFSRGVVRCRDVFKSGITIGLFEYLSRAADELEKPQAYIESILSWSILEVIRLHIEMCEIYRTSNELNKPPPPISSNKNKRTESAVELSLWVLENLIGNNNHVHQICYEIGRVYAPRLSGWLAPVSIEELSIVYQESVISQLRSIFIEIPTRKEKNFLFFYIGLESMCSHLFKIRLLQLKISLQQIC
jgi:hypothetical protein